MGNISSANAYRLNEKLQKHTMQMNMMKVTSKDEPKAYLLYESHTFLSETSKFFIQQKIFVKEDPQEKMEQHVRNLTFIREGINESLYPYFILPAYSSYEDLPVLTRQHLHNSLQDKLQSGIPMSFHQKAYVAMQILLGVGFLHELGLFHGNLKSSNILLTSDNLVFISDIAPYKPQYFDQNDFDRISLFFPDLLEHCYLAPERVYQNDPPLISSPYWSQLENSEVKRFQQQDLFAVGCILYDIFSGGKPYVDYKELLQVKSDGGGSFSAVERLEKIEDEGIRGVISKMVQKNPEMRKGCFDSLESFKDIYNTQYFETLIHLNYALRRPEFQHPDIRLGLLRILSPFIFDSFSTLNVDSSMKSILESIQFKSYFPYQISKEKILNQFLTIFTNCPIRKFFELNDIETYLRSQISKIQKEEGILDSENSRSKTILENISCLKKGEFNYQNRRQVNEEENGPANILDGTEGSDISPKQIYTQKLREAAEKRESQHQNSQVNSIHLILDSILSLMRNLQIDQSFRVGLEMISEYTKLIWDQQVIQNVIPFISNFVIKNKRQTLALVAMRLFCKLIGRIRYFPDELANSSTFAVYIQPLRDYCLAGNQQMLKILASKHLHRFVELKVLSDILCQRKTVSLKFPSEKLLTFDEIDIEAASDQIMEFFKIEQAKDILESKDDLGNLILKVSGDEQCLTNIAPSLDKIEVYIPKNNLTKILYVLKKNIEDSSNEVFKAICLKTISVLARRIPKRSLLSLTKFVLKIIEETSNLSTICESLRCLLRFQSCYNDDIIITRQILEKTIVLILHPCLRVRKLIRFLIKQIMAGSDKDTIARVYAPVLSEYTQNQLIPLDYNIFRLTRHDYLSYMEYQRLQNIGEGKGSMNNMKVNYQLFLNNFKFRNLSQKQPERKFKIIGKPTLQNISHKIDEFLGYTMIFEIIEQNKPLKQMAKKERMGDRYKALLSNALYDNYQLSISPYWKLTKNNFENLKKFKDEYVSNTTARGIFDRNYNLDVLRLIFNDMSLKFSQLSLEFINDNTDLPKNSIPATSLYKWNPSGILLSSINEHQGKVNSLANLSSILFASGSSDGTVKIHNISSIKRNYTHRSISSFDFNGLDGAEGDVEINKILFLPELQKLAVFSNTPEFHTIDIEKNKIASKYYTGKSIVRTGNLLEYKYAGNCIGALTNDSEFIVIDPRVAKPVQSCDLNKVRGVPSGITYINNTSVNVIGTYKGYLISQDLRANSCTNVKRLVIDKKQLPIFSVAQHIPQTQTRNMSSSDELVTLTYPSSFNEFSVFQTNNLSSNKINPKIHFYSTKPENKSSIPVLAPHLEDVTTSELFIDYHNQCKGKFSIFKDWELDKITGHFKLGNAFQVSSVDSIVNLYQQPFHDNIMKVKQGWINNFDVIMDTLSGFSRSKNTIYKALNLPQERFLGQEVRLDNIVITGGSDKNIRFINFGNQSGQKDFDKEYGNMNCFHLSNVDNQCRKYEYANSGDICLMKEVQVSSESSFDVQVDPVTNDRTFANGFSYYHNNFLYKKKNTHSLPGHTSTIRDFLIMKNESDLLLVSSSDDSSIKVWSQLGGKDL